MSTNPTPWGTTLFFEVSSAAPDDEPVWVDLSDRVLDVGMPAETWEGRQTELDDVDPGRLQLQLRNRDDALTPGNPTSPYPWWKQKRRCRFREVVGYMGYDLGDGFLEIPDVLVRTQEELATDSDVTLFVSGVDILGRLRDSRKFSSALSEHILYNGGTDLVGYWLLTDPAPPFVGVGPELSPIVVTRTFTGTYYPADDVLPQTGLTPTGSEASGVRCPTSTNGSGRAFVQLSAPSGYAPAIADGDGLTIVAWYSLPTINAASFHQIGVGGIAGSSSISLTLERDVTTAIWTLTASGAMTGSVAMGGMGTGALLPIGIHIRPSTSVMELWVGGQRGTTTLAGSPPTGMSFSNWDWGFQLDYDLAEWQIYVGSTWTRTEFMAQIQQGHAPLDQQYTGERINTILNYAGHPAGRRDIDQGVSVMGPAALAGKNVQTLLDEAKDTEQGRLFAHAGRVKFHDRRRIYDV